jgi:hypothetical protein
MTVDSTTDADTTQADATEDDTEATTAGQTDADDHGDLAEDADEDHDDDGDQDGQGGQPGRERRLRQRAQRAEGERDALAETLARTREVIVNATVKAAGFHPEQFGKLLTKTDRTPENMLDDGGMIDPKKLDEAIRITALDFDLKPRGFLAPNLQQGTSGGHSHGSSTWSGALKGKGR